MALSSLAAELLGSLQIHEYRKYIPALHYGTGVTERLFAGMPDSIDHEIDTTRTYRGKQCKTLNPNQLFEIFGVYNGEEPDVVRAMMVKWVRDNSEEFEKATGLGMLGKDLDIDNWLIDMSSSRTRGDEFALFALCKLYHRHACIVNTSRLWHTCSVEGCPDEESVKARCDLRFIQLTCDSWALLRPKPGSSRYLQGSIIAEGSVTNMLHQASVGKIKLPLQSQPQDLPVELPDETPSQILPIPGPYVATSGLEVNYPERDELPEILELPDDTVDVVTNQQDKQCEDPRPISGTITTRPCGVILRKLTAKDITLWEPKNKNIELPDETDVADVANIQGPPGTVPVILGTATISTPPVLPPGPRMVSGYGLRNRPKPIPSGKAGPSRASKSKVCFDGLFSTDESSQDSKLLVDADDEQDEMAKLVKITGLSEPSPYRIAAQRFIAAQKRGLLPPPPNQSLPGVKVKSSSSSSDDSDATVIYETPKLVPEKDPDYVLPDETEHSKGDEVGKKKPKTKQTKKVVIKFKTYGIKKRKQPGYIASNRKFKCAKCDKVFLTIDALNRHFIGNHRKLKCQDCGKTFQKPRSYQKHLYSHNVKAHKCTVCGKGFSFLSHLKTHEETHTGSKRFKCSAKNCDRDYSSKSDLVKHERTHTNSILKCSHKGCKYSTKDDRNLKSHMKNHTQKLRHFCPICKKGFVHNTQMIRHKKKCPKLKRSDSPVF